MTAATTRVATALEARIYRYFGRRVRDLDCPQGIVSFTFDDFPASAAAAGATLLEEFGWRGTFYLAAGIVDKDSTVGRICSMDDVERLRGAGHEVGNHTDSHANLAEAGRIRVAEELAISMRKLERFDGNKSFALPFGAYSFAAMNRLSGRFQTIRTVVPGINRGPTDINLLRANAVYENSDMAALCSMIDATADLGGWLIFYTHDVCAAPSPFGCTPKRFRTLLEAVRARALRVEPVRTAFGVAMHAGSSRSGVFPTER